MPSSTWRARRRSPRLIELAPEPSQVVTIANYDRRQHRGPAHHRRRGRPASGAHRGAHLLEQSQLVIKVQTFPLDRVAEAHRISQSGHVRGKIVLLP